MNLLTAVDLADAIRSRKITAVDATTPAGWHEAHAVPLGVQIIAPPLPNAEGEALILSLALQLERVQPWPRVAPSL